MVQATNAAAAVATCLTPATLNVTARAAIVPVGSNRTINTTNNATNASAATTLNPLRLRVLTTVLAVVVVITAG